MLVGGYHLILDLTGCNPRILNSKSAMIRLCRELARLMGARIIHIGGHQFSPKGVTAWAIIEESHITVHTWPEKGKAFFDVFTCQRHFRSLKAAEHAVAFTEARNGYATLLRRKGRTSVQLFSGPVAPQSQDFDYGRIIFSFRSPYQRIELTKGSLGVSMFLDTYWQFVERYEHIYHEVLAHPALACAPRLDRVGIAGGGDGLALREVLRYPRLGRADLYELDPYVLALADGHPEMLRLNQRSLRHPKARVRAQDARRMLTPGAGYDAVILDFPSISDGYKFDTLYSVGFYRRLKRALSPQAVVVCQVTDYPWNLLRTTWNLKQVFPWVLPVDVGVEFSMFNFVLASMSPFRQRRPLPQGLRFLNKDILNRLLAASRRPSSDLRPRFKIPASV